MTPQEIHNVTTQKGTGNTETFDDNRMEKAERRIKGSHITSGTQLIFFKNLYYCCAFSPLRGQTSHIQRVTWRIHGECIQGGDL